MEHRSATQPDAVAHPVDVRPYLAVFGALMVLTVVTVGVSYLRLSMTPTVLVALAIATAKASLVAIFFMHLKGERPMVYWPLGLTAVLFVALFAFLLWSEGDHLFGTRFDDAFDAGGSETTVPQPAGGH
jgi:cytochrome c oxidase subunit IV